MKKQTSSPFQSPKPTIPPNVPVKHSDSQPLGPGISLNVKSVLRDIIESRLPVDTIRKLR